LAADLQPETVLITYRVKVGSEADMEQQIAKHWKTATSLNLVDGSRHLVFRGSDEERPYYVEIFSWQGASVPDDPPKEIKAIWSDMSKLVESRRDKPGIEIGVVSEVGSAERQTATEGSAQE
jgi:hypothetical protein